MKSKKHIENRIENYFGMTNYRNVSVYPKVLETKKHFTPEEKRELTRPGLRWYVYYSFRHPITKEFKRQKPIYWKINQHYPDFDDRYRELFLMKQGVLQNLKNGYNPYNETKEKEFKLISALDFALEQKKSEVVNKTFESYQIAVKRLKEWLVKNGYEHISVKKVDKKIIGLFLNYTASISSNRSRNNYKNSLSAIFTKLVDLDYLEHNFVIGIKDLEAEPKIDPTYSDKQVESVLKYLEENDRVMLMFVYFVSYLFWRPKENCRLRVKDINLEQRLITAPKTKTKGNKTKLIPGIIFEELKEYIKDAEPEDLLFTPSGPGKWDRQLDGRRAVFTNRYRDLKKKMGIPGEYTIYSFRHTFVTRAYQRIKEEVKTKEDTLNILSQITGHDSKAIKSYIHFIDADLPEDYSRFLEKK